MELDDLTPELLEAALRAFRQAEAPPAVLLTLTLVHSPGLTSNAERELALRTQLTNLITSALAAQRQAEGSLAPPPALVGREALKAALTADFQRGNQELEAWSALYHRYLASPALSVEELAEAIPVSPQHFRRRVNLGLAYLLRALYAAECEARRRYTPQLDWRLPAPEYDRLFGVEEQLQTLVTRLQAPDGPHFLSLEGLGGIGKTALARAAAQQCARLGTLTGILWVSARHERLTENGTLQPTPDAVRSLEEVVGSLVAQLGWQDLNHQPVTAQLARLSALFTTTPYLVVIDNLEVLTDSAALLPALYPLAGATRFLLTSRHTLSHFPYVHVVPVPQLSPAHSQELIISELQRRGYPAAIPADWPARLYELIGGLPLALKLAAAQLGRLSPAEILAGLRQANRQEAEQLYTFIYRRTWELLDDLARQLLVYGLLPLDPAGETLEFIQWMSGLDDDDFAQALTQLQAYSLLEPGRDLTTPRYLLHRLTVTFLQTEILQRWDTVAATLN